MNYKQKRLNYLESKIKTPSNDERTIELLIKSMDLKKSVLQQVRQSISIDVVYSLIGKAKNLRNETIQELHKRDIDTLTDEELLLCVNGDDSYILEDEKIFINAYDEAFEYKFFPNESEAISNYLNMIQDDKPMLLNVLLEEFLI